jgi:hypothetical protein
MNQHLETLRGFTEGTLPDLDTVVLGALEFLSDVELPVINIGGFKKMLVVGSENALATGKMLFQDGNTIFRNESTYKEVFATQKDIDAVTVISASGGKHAIEIVKEAVARDLSTFLITNTQNSPAGTFLDPSCVTVFPKVREPYTYNTSTYMGMLIAHSGEDPISLMEFIERNTAAKIPEILTVYDAFFFIVPAQFDAMRQMFKTKFDELFGPLLNARVFTVEQTKHAKTVIPSETECFVSFGEENMLFGKEANRLTVPLPPNAGPVAMMAIGYYMIGRIQKQFPPYFKDNIKNYAAETSRMFGQTINVIVE